MASVLKFLFNIALGILQALFGGFVLSKMWAWFIVPKFAGAPNLSYLDSVGVSMTVNFLLLGLYMSSAMGEKETEGVDAWTKGIIKSAIMIILVYPLTLLAAYVWHQFIQ